MKNKWKKTGAALLIAGLTVSGTGYALADGKVIDLSVLKKDAAEESPVSPVKEVVETDTDANKEADTETNNVTKFEADKEDGATDSDQKDGSTKTDKEDGTKESDNNEATETEENELPEIPEGYTAGNLAALAKAYEQVQNPNAKAAIKRNMERSIAKWESKQPVEETPKVEVKEKTLVTEETPKVEEPVKEEAPVHKVKEKNPQAELNAKHKVQKEELKAAQKAEREALKEDRKADKEQLKQERKAGKEQQKQEKNNKNN